MCWLVSQDPLQNKFSHFILSAVKKTTRRSKKQEMPSHENPIKFIKHGEKKGLFEKCRGSSTEKKIVLEEVGPRFVSLFIPFVPLPSLPSIESDDTVLLLLFSLCHFYYQMNHIYCNLRFVSFFFLNYPTHYYYSIHRRSHRWDTFYESWKNILSKNNIHIKFQITNLYSLPSPLTSLTTRHQRRFLGKKDILSFISKTL